jgi:hypothetical protein
MSKKPNKAPDVRRIAMRVLSVIAISFVFHVASPLMADETLTSPRGTFTITQHRDADWVSKLHFTKPGHADIMLNDAYSWPALFYVSPDDQWILQIQKSGSGDNISFLYRLDRSGRLWRMERHFGEPAFAYLERSHGVTVADLYHTGIEFTDWNLKAGTLRFTIRGSSTKKSGEGVNRELIYDLQKHTFRNP